MADRGSGVGRGPAQNGPMTVRLVGRVSEVVTLDRVRAAAAGGTGSAVLLVGEAGIGKTAVAEEAADRAAAAGSAVLTGRAVADEGAPAFWPWLRLLDDATRAGVRGLPPSLLELARPEHDGVGGETPATVRFRAVQDTVRALRAAATRPGGLVLVLEDLHWADAPSVALLRHLCADLTDVPLLVLGTVRAGADGPFVVSDFAGLRAVQVLTLGPLEPAAVGAFLAQQSDGRVHGSWTTAVHRLSGGNPLYVRELARMLVLQQRLDRPAGDVALPVELRRLVGHRTAQLTAACQDLLGGCAALGADIDIPLLRAAVDDPATVDPLLDEAVAAGVLIDDPWRPATVRFSHDLVRQARYGELSRAERLDWHRRIADALDAAAAPPAEVARHRVRAAVDADSRRAAARACREAARAAGRGLDHSEAVHWYGRAAELTGPDDPAGRAVLLLARAEAAYRGGELTKALADCATVVGLAEGLGLPDLAVEAALVVRGVAGPFAPALLALCERVGALLTGEDSARHARVLAQHAFLLAAGGVHARAEPVSRAAMSMADRSGEAVALVAAIHARHQVIDHAGRVDEVLGLADRMASLSRDSGRPDTELWARTWRIDAHFIRGDLAAVDVETVALTGLADRIKWPVARWHLLRTHAARALLTGRFTAAERFAVEARDLAARSDDSSAAGLFLAFMGELVTHTGRTELYTGEIRGAMSTVLDIPIAAAQLGQIALHLGDLDTATTCWQHLAPVLPGLPRDNRWAYVSILAGETAAALGELDRAAECYALTRQYGGVYLNTTTSCHGAAARPLGLVASAIGRHDDADRHLAEAVSMEERIGALPYLAKAQLAHAQALVARAAAGDRRRACGLAERAVAIARRLGMPDVAAAGAALIGELSGTAEGMAGLTAREREIAGLLVAGLANRAIADRLVVSERTVETHVRNLLAKLGLGNRTQVAAWALRAGLRTGSAREH